jgi:hypothetical protein
MIAHKHQPGRASSRTTTPHNQTIRAYHTATKLPHGPLKASNRMLVQSCTVCFMNEQFLNRYGSNHLLPSLGSNLPPFHSTTQERSSGTQDISYSNKTYITSQNPQPPSQNEGGYLGLVNNVETPTTLDSSMYLLIISQAPCSI